MFYIKSLNHLKRNGYFQMSNTNQASGGVNAPNFVTSTLSPESKQPSEEPESLFIVLNLMR